MVQCVTENCNHSFTCAFLRSTLPAVRGTLSRVRILVAATTQRMIIE